MCEKIPKGCGQMTKTRKAEILKYKNELKETNERLKYILWKIESLAEIEQDCVDNTPENLQSTSRYEESEEVAENLACAAESLQEVVDYLDEI